MKKLIIFLLVLLFVSSNSYAEDKITINSLLKQGYKITNEEIARYQNGDAAKIISLTKKNDYFVCTFIVTPYFESKTKCIYP